jgi:Fe-S-cluster containining protein
MENRYTFKVKEDGSCIFQSPDKMVRRCTIHQVRPIPCRMFPYTDSCPYLEREDLLAEIQPRIEKKLIDSCQNGSFPKTS